MKRTLKSIILKIFILTFVIMSVLTFSLACKPSSESQEEILLDINKASANILLYQTETLSVAYNGNSNLVWSVENSDIVSVDNGKIIAKAVGSTFVTVTDSDLSDQCLVTVLPLNEDKFDIDIDVANVSLYVGDTHKITANLQYDGKSLTNVSYEYLTMDDSKVSVNSSGLINAIALGQTSIVVRATYYEFSISKTVNVSIVSPYSISLEKDEFKLLVKGESAQTSEQLKVVVKNRNENMSGFNILYKAIDPLQDVVEISNEGVISAVNSGSTLIEVSAIIEGDIYTAMASVTVLPVSNTINNEEIFIDLSTKTYDIDYSEFNISDPVIGAYIESNGVKTPVEVNGNQLAFANIDAGNKTLVIQTRNENYEIAVDLWTAVIDSAEELKCLYNATTGKYLLGANLDLSDVAWEYETSYNIFTGVFDGQQHKITGLNITGSHGLFYNVGNGAVIKNLEITAQMTSESAMTGVVFASAESGATVSVENVDITVLDSGNLNGGVGGLVSSKAKLNITNSSILYYNVYSNSDNGSISARCSGAINFENTEIYSSLQACGTKIVDGNSVKTATTINKKAVESGVVIAPTSLDKLNVNLDSTVMNTAPTSDTAKGIYLLSLPTDMETGDIGTYYMFGKTLKEGEFTVNKGYTILKNDILDMVGSTVELYFTDSTGKIYYISHELISELHIYQENVQELANVTDGKVLIKEDLDLKGYEYWVSNTIFVGELDGEEHIIQNLRVRGDKYNGVNSFGLFYQFGGKIKNLIFVDAYVSNNSGILAYSLISNADVMIENVFVGQTSGAFGAKTYTGGFIARINQNSAKITIKDVVFSAAETTKNAGSFGFVSGFGGASVFLENCYLIGGKDFAVGQRDGYAEKVTGSYKYFASEIEFYEENKKQNSSINLTSLLSKGVEKGIKIVEVTKSNIEVLASATTGMYILTEDITLPSTYNDTTGRFQGTFIGGGHTITVQNKTGVFFGLQNCTIKDVTIIMENGVDAQKGAFGYQSRESVTIDNVFIQIKNSISGQGGAIIGIVFSGTLNLNNVVVSTGSIADKTSIGIIAGFGNADKKSKVTATNLYIISNIGLTGNLDSSYSRAITVNGTLIDSNDERFTTLEGIKVYKTVADFKGDTNKILTEFLTTQVNELV
ncbi:MAG: hypothetical protein IJX03_04775 [Clostridia bacterium]|nr:hypothetical protein [Clostridia bacterium]